MGELLQKEHIVRDFISSTAKRAHPAKDVAKVAEYRVRNYLVSLRASYKPEEFGVTNPNSPVRSLVILETVLIHYICQVNY